MGLGFLPWEKWLPPYIFGPLLCTISVSLLLGESELSWWKLLVFSFGAVFGAWGTWAWFKEGRNIFDGSISIDPKYDKKRVEDENHRT